VTAASPTRRYINDLLHQRKDYHQQYLFKVPNGYCPNHSTGVFCPVGLGVSSTAATSAEAEAPAAQS
jgi:hypothetical protein